MAVIERRNNMTELEAQNRLIRELESDPHYLAGFLRALGTTYKARTDAKNKAVGDLLVYASRNIAAEAR